TGCVGVLPRAGFPGSLRTSYAGNRNDPSPDAAKQSNRDTSSWPRNSMADRRMKLAGRDASEGNRRNAPESPFADYHRLWRGRENRRDRRQAKLRKNRCPSLLRRSARKWSKADVAAGAAAHPGSSWSMAVARLSFRLSQVRIIL